MAPSTSGWAAFLLGLALGCTAPLAAVAQQQTQAGELSIRQFIPLRAGEREELRRLISENSEAAELWRGLRVQADAALTSPPSPLATIHYEGLLDTDARRIATVASLGDMDRLSVLGYAHAASGDSRYAEAARELVLAWARAYRPTGNPINENKLEPVWLVFSALEDRFTPSERAELHAWVREVARAELASGAAWTAGAHKNNWDTKRIKIVGGIGLASRDPELTARAFEAYRQFVADALHADGTSTDLHDRDALSYHVNALTPLLALAILADRSDAGLDGEELFAGLSPTGSSVRRSVEYVLPFASGEQVRPEWTHSTAAIDRRRAEAGIARYQPGRPYDPEQATEMLELASYFEPEHARLAGRLQGRDGDRYPTWLVLVLDAARRGARMANAPGAPEDVPLFDFESGNWDGWEVDGAAFGAGPVSSETVAGWGARAPVGMQGRYMVATGTARHDVHPEGRMVSREFTITRPYLTFLLAGELHPRVGVALLVEGREVRRAHGNNTYDLIRRGWDVTEFIGRSARLLIEDAAASASLLRADDFRLSSAPPPDPGSFDVIRRQESNRVRAGEFRLLVDSYDLGEGVGIFHSTISHGPDGRWHLFGSAGAEADRYRPSAVKQLVHASAPELSGPWTWHGVVIEASADHGEEFVNEPAVVVHEGRFYLFYVASGSGFPGWERGVCHWEAGRFTAMEGCTHGPFHIHLATSADARHWQRQGIVVSDAPFTAGPSIRRIGDQWVMYYGSAEPAMTMGRHAIVYRTSADLARWSSQRGVAFLDSSPTTPWPEHPFLRDPVVLRRGATWYLFTGSVNNDNLSRYHVLWPFTSQSPFSWEHSASPPHGRLFVDGGAEILRDREGRWFVSTGNVLAGGVWLAPLHWRDGEDGDDVSVPPPP